MKKILFLLILTFIFAACDVNVNTEQTNTDETEKVEAVKKELQIAIIDIKGMHDESCVNTITTVLTELEGVKNAKASLEYEQAKVKFDRTVISIDDIKAAIEDKDYEVGEIEMIEMQERAKKPEK